MYDADEGRLLLRTLRGTYLKREKWGAEPVEDLRPPPYSQLVFPVVPPTFPRPGTKLGL